MKNTRFILTLLSVFALILLGLYAADLNNVRIRNAQTEALLAEMDSVAKDRALVQTARSIRNMAREDINLFESFVLTGETLVPTIEMIEKAGVSLGLATEIVSVENGKVDEPGEPALVNFVVETRGSWAGSMRFLKALESLPNRVVMNNVYFSKEANTWRSTYSFALYTFN